MDCSATASAGMMLGLRDAIDVDAAAGRALLYSGTKTGGGITTQQLVADCPLAFPCGIVGADGALTFAQGEQGLVVSSATPTWARIVTASGVRVGELTLRLSGAPDAGQEMVIDAPSLAVGAYVRVVSGSLSAATAG